MGRGLPPVHMTRLAPAKPQMQQMHRDGRAIFIACSLGCSLCLKHIWPSVLLC